MPQILYVDDEPNLQKAFQRTWKYEKLLGQAVNVLLAEDGEGGLKVYAANHGSINLIVTDNDMPKPDNGLLLLADLLKQFPDEQLPPRIMVSGRATPELYTAGKLVRATGLIAKPYSVEELVSIFTEVLTKSGKYPTLDHYHAEHGFLRTPQLYEVGEALVRDGQRPH